MLSAVRAPFLWFSDILLSFVVSASILSLPVYGWVLLCRRLRRHFSGWKFWLIATLPINILSGTTLWRVFDILWNTDGVAVTTIADVLPRLVIPLDSTFGGVELKLVTVGVAMTKTLLVLCILFFVPIFIFALYSLSGASKLLVFIAADIIERYQRWRWVQARTHANPNLCIYFYGWAEMRYQNTLLGNALVKEIKANKMLGEQLHMLDRQLQEERKLPKRVRKPKEGDELLCVVCLERQRQFLLRPCKHYCVCNACRNKLKNKCPICRKVIQNYEKVYIV